MSTGGRMPPEYIQQPSASNYEAEMFVPRPGVRRKYTVAQLLLLREILPFIMCRRDRLKDNAFKYFLVKIKGLRNESTHDHIIDEYIIRKQVKAELAMRDSIKKDGYRYLGKFARGEQDLKVKALWVEIHAASTWARGYRNAYGPVKLSETEQEAAVTVAQRKRDMVERPRHPPKHIHKKEEEVHQVEPAPPQMKFEGPATKWGTPYGYKVENLTPTKKPGSFLGMASSGQDQLAYIQYMCQFPLAPVLTADVVTATSGGDNSQETVQQSNNNPILGMYNVAEPASNSNPILTARITKEGGHSRTGSKTSVGNLIKNIEMKRGHGRTQSTSSVSSLQNIGNTAVNAQQNVSGVSDKAVKSSNGIENAGGSTAGVSIGKRQGGDEMPSLID